MPYLSWSMVHGVSGVLMPYLSWCLRGSDVLPIMVHGVSEGF